MAKVKNNNTEKTAMKRPPKTRHIDVRFTEEEYDEVVHNARLSGRSKSTYLHDLGIGHKPSLPMTEGQEEALKGLIGARSELVYAQCASCPATDGETETIQESRLHGALATRYQHPDRGTESY